MNFAEGRAAALGVVALALLAGCSPSEEAESASHPRQVEFHGKVDPALVGSWIADNGRSGLDLGKDGKAKILVVSASPSGDRKSSIEGQWLSKGQDLLLRYTAQGQPESTVKYEFELAGTKLTLVQAAGRMKTVYRRQ